MSHYKSGVWSVEEDELLAQWQTVFGNRWSEVARKIPGKTGQQCAQRWRHRVNPNIRREKWTSEEDKLLAKLFAEHGNSWAVIARCMPGRTDQQCMGRWRRHLDPTIRREGWTPDEDYQLHSLVEVHGCSWSSISKSLRGRTPQQCRTRWHYLSSNPAAAEASRAKAAKASAVAAGGNSQQPKKRGRPSKASKLTTSDPTIDTMSPIAAAHQDHLNILSPQTHHIHRRSSAVTTAALRPSKRGRPRKVQEQQPASRIKQHGDGDVGALNFGDDDDDDEAWMGYVIHGKDEPRVINSGRRLGGMQRSQQRHDAPVTTADGSVGALGGMAGAVPGPPGETMGMVRRLSLLSRSTRKSLSDSEEGSDTEGDDDEEEEEEEDRDCGNNKRQINYNEKDTVAAEQGAGSRDHHQGGTRDYHHLPPSLGAGEVTPSPGSKKIQRTSAMKRRYEDHGDHCHQDQARLRRRFHNNVPHGTSPAGLRDDVALLDGVELAAPVLLRSPLFVHGASPGHPLVAPDSYNRHQQFHHQHHGSSPPISPQLFCPPAMTPPWSKRKRPRTSRLAAFGPSVPGGIYEGGEDIDGAMLGARLPAHAIGHVTDPEHGDECRRDTIESAMVVQHSTAGMETPTTGGAFRRRSLLPSPILADLLHSPQQAQHGVGHGGHRSRSERHRKREEGDDDGVLTADEDDNDDGAAASPKFKGFVTPDWARAAAAVSAVAEELDAQRRQSIASVARRLEVDSVRLALCNTHQHQPAAATTTATVHHTARRDGEDAHGSIMDASTSVSISAGGIPAVSVPLQTILPRSNAAIPAREDGIPAVATPINAVAPGENHHAMQASSYPQGILTQQQGEGQLQVHTIATPVALGDTTLLRPESGSTPGSIFATALHTTLMMPGSSIPGSILLQQQHQGQQSNGILQFHPLLLMNGQQLPAISMQLDRSLQPSAVHGGVTLTSTKQRNSGRVESDDARGRENTRPMSSENLRMSLHALLTS